MKPKAQAIIYTILADDKAVAALQATGTEARELLKEKWFHEELAALKVDGEPLHKSGTRLRVRPATEEEWVRYDEASKEAGTSEDIQFVYLIDLDDP